MRGKKQGRNGRKEWKTERKKWFTFWLYSSAEPKEKFGTFEETTTTATTTTTLMDVWKNEERKRCPNRYFLTANEAQQTVLSRRFPADGSQQTVLPARAGVFHLVNQMKIFLRQNASAQKKISKF